MLLLQNYNKYNVLSKTSINMFAFGQNNIFTYCFVVLRRNSTSMISTKLVFYLSYIFTNFTFKLSVVVIEMC